MNERITEILLSLPEGIKTQAIAIYCVVGILLSLALIVLILAVVGTIILAFAMRSPLRPFIVEALDLETRKEWKPKSVKNKR